MNKRQEALEQQRMMKRTLIDDDGHRLVFRDKFNIGWFIFWLILTGIGAVIYLIYYYTKPKIYIQYKR